MSTPVTGPSVIGRSLARIFSIREVSLLVVLFLLCLLVGLTAPHFLTWTNLTNVLLSATIVGIVAVGQAIVVITKNIDLSVGSSTGLAALGAAELLVRNPSIPLPVLCLVACLIGAFLGLMNGVLVAFGGVPAIVTTLGTLYIFRGVTFLLAGGKQVSASDLPSNYLAFATTKWVGLPAPAVVLIVLGAAAAIVLKQLRVGRNLYAIGNSPSAARQVGISVRAHVMVAFVISGTLAGLAGFVYGAQYGSIDARAGVGLEFQVVAAVVVGGVAVTGGVGTIPGALIGAVLLATIGNALNILNLDPNWLRALSGAALVIAVTLDLALQQIQQRRLIRGTVGR